MLSDLHIENIAVIERADVSFGKGLNVLTGETGAGKSIIIDAIQAVLGARTSRELVRSGADKAVASAVFETERADKWLEDNEIDSEGELILQRRISADGKTSSRVCGAPVTAAQLRELSSLLLDIHGQNDGRLLMDESRHREYLDSFGDYDGLLTAYSRTYNEYRDTKREIDKLTRDSEEKDRLTDVLEATVQELSSAELTEGEEAELADKRELMRNSEKFTNAVNAAYGALYGDSANAVTLAETAENETAAAGRYCPELESAAASVKEAVLLMKDVAETLRDVSSRYDFSPEEYDRVEARLSVLKRLERKYSTDESGLLEKLEAARDRLSKLEYGDLELDRLKKQLGEKEKAVAAASGELTKARKAAARELEKQITEELSQLSMPSVSFVVDIKPLGGAFGFDSTGGDGIMFLMSANAGEKPGAISRIASGGELSRIMLAMKNVFSKGDGIETSVFDEIDTGVSGIAAQRVAEKLAQLSRDRQVLCVTHLPQIAAMADRHFLIEKSEKDGRTFTSVTALDREGRKQELSRLLGGENITLNTLATAAEQLDAAETFKKNIR